MVGKLASKAGKYLLKKSLKWLAVTIGPYFLAFALLLFLLTSFFGSFASGDYNADNKTDQADQNFVLPYKQEVDKVNPQVKSNNRLEENYILDWGILYAIDISAEPKEIQNADVENHAKDMAQALRPKFTYTKGTITITEVRPEKEVTDANGKKTKVGGTTTQTIPVDLLEKADTYDGVTEFHYEYKTTVTHEGDATITRTEPRLSGFPKHNEDYTRLNDVIKKYMGKTDVTVEDRGWILQLAKGVKEQKENLDWLLNKGYNFENISAYFGEIPPQLVPIFKAAGEKYNIPWTVLVAIAKVESTFNPDAIGQDTDTGRASGMMQFMKSTWDWMGVDGDNDGIKDPFNPADAIFSAAHYLNYLYFEKYPNDLYKAVKYYGEGTDAYADKVMSLKDQYEYSMKVGENGYLWPVMGTDMKSITQFYHAGHPAIDIGATEKTPIQAPIGGKIVHISRVGDGSDPNGGNSLQLLGKDGNIWYFAHLYQHNVTLGQEVQQGETIGLMGSTGESSGPHLHLELWLNGVFKRNADPLPYIQR